ncbi:MAG: BlaI/MecI/CopY family transcriptional regulator, partial [Lachnospiraceae bacterium]|nr:BlaI/MecI/CopY family transcriptional regulator [Lachnospiraceae bacterium]
MGKSVSLSDVERKIMKYIWSCEEPVMVSDIIEYFGREYRKQYAASTVNTMLQRLISKG